MYRLGYNTNGFAHHRPEEALRVLADLGYGGVALTPDVGPLDPLRPDPGCVERVRRTAEDLDLLLNVESGARFVLDPRVKHFPTLLEQDGVQRARRVDFLCRSLDLAARLGAPVLSLWSGRAPSGECGDGPEAEDHPVIWRRLVEGLDAVLEHADGVGVRVGFEPEPGMFLERARGYRQLVEKMGAIGATLGLTLDVGHSVCMGDDPVSELENCAAELVAVQLDDMLPGDHHHRMFGEGAVDLHGCLSALSKQGFEGLAAVELSRESHRAPEAARIAFDHLKRAQGPR